MRLRLKTLLFLFFLGISCSVRGELPRPELETLPNGLQVVWFLNDRLPLIDFSLVVQSGYRDDSKGKSGALELLLALLNRSTEGRLLQTIEKLGGTYALSADGDQFGASVHGLSSDADSLLEVLGKWILKLDFSQGEVQREKIRLLDRLGGIQKENGVLLEIAYRRVLMSGTPYGRGSFSSQMEFAQIQREDVLQFYRRFFTPKNSFLMVVGRGNKNNLKDKILSVFGTWKGEKPKTTLENYTDPRLEKKIQSSKKPAILVVDVPHSAQSQLKLGFSIPPIESSEHFALLVANAALGGAFTSRLNVQIREQLALSSAISSTLAFQKGFADFTLAAAIQNEKSGLLVKTLLNALSEFRETRLNEADVESAKDYLIGRFSLNHSSLDVIASRWISGYSLGLDPKYLNSFIENLRKVKSQEVQSVLKKYFSVDRGTIVVVGDSKKIRKSLNAARLTSFRRLSASDLK
jgi:zinc protease